MLIRVATFLWLGSVCFAAIADDSEERMLDFLIHQKRLSEGFNVSIHVKAIGQREGQPMGTYESFQRLIIADAGKKQRIDAQCNDLFTAFNPRTDTYESQLWLPVECRYVNFLHTRAEIKLFEVRAGQSECRTISHRVHPFVLSTTNWGGTLSDTSLGLFALDNVVLREDELRDGSLISVMRSGNSKAGSEVVFGDEPKWGPTKIKMYTRRDRSLPKGRDINDADVKGWLHYCTTTTEWTQHEESKNFVPKTVRVEEIDNGRSDSKEIDFTDWKFGKEVDLTLLDPVNFQLDKIKTQCDFVAMRKKFEKFDEERDAKQLEKSRKK
ncbi:MAG: hypothetical protein ABL921_27660 [Pirellula sp.]